VDADSDARFKNLWRAERLPDEDLQALESAIMHDPAANA